MNEFSTPFSTFSPSFSTNSDSATEPVSDSFSDPHFEFSSFENSHFDALPLGDGCSGSKPDVFAKREGGKALDGRRICSSEEQWRRWLTSHELLSAAEEKRLAQRLRLGDESALERLSGCNLRLVWHMATQMHRSYVGALSVNDLFQEGFLGLLHAVRRFDPDRDCRLSTYAVPWIRVNMVRALHKQGHMIHYPEQVLQRRRALDEKVRHWTQSQQETPTLQTQRALAPASWKNDFAAGVQEVVSLDAFPSSADGRPFSESWLESLRDPAVPVETEVQRRAVREAIEEALRKLSVSEKRVLCCRFGLEGQRSHTLQETARHLGLSPEKVRKIEARGLRQLRADKHLHALCSDESEDGA